MALFRKGLTLDIGVIMNKRIKDITGKKYGKLKVLGFVKKNKTGHSLWKCKCICGKIKVILGTSLTRGASKSCGAQKCKANTFKKGKAAFNHLYKNYEGAARRRGIEFNLTREQFKKITKQNCHYCGQKPKQILEKSYYNGKYIYNGLDRKNNNKGYTIKNSLPCCGICNRTKNNLSYTKFKNLIGRIYNNLNVGEKCK